MRERGATAETHVADLTDPDAAAKHALDGFAAVAREELPARGIRVINVYPAASDTQIWRAVPGEVPRERMMSPVETADAIAYALERPKTVLVDSVHVGGDLGESVRGDQPSAAMASRRLHTMGRRAGSRASTIPGAALRNNSVEVNPASVVAMNDRTSTSPALVTRHREAGL